jgi:hypothetical protein
MRILDQIEVENTISQGRLAPEQEITAMLDELETKHPAISRVIYGEPSDAISDIPKEMADLYLDLSCDVIWLFIKAFGKVPEIDNEEQRVARDLSLIDAESKALTAEIPMNSTFRYNLQNRFVKRGFEAKIQLNLLQYLEIEVEKYA